mmetsp:Transcript_24611/g.79579  ORF Transcript_24611/g.79579 Transcript_24611/m.79579 type:complete len:246 (-) Transcript_24611:1137-1874(-)
MYVRSTTLHAKLGEPSHSMHALERTAYTSHLESFSIFFSIFSIFSISFCLASNFFCSRSARAARSILTSCMPCPDFEETMRSRGLVLGSCWISIRTHVADLLNHFGLIMSHFVSTKIRSGPRLPKNCKKSQSASLNPYLGSTKTYRARRDLRLQINSINGPPKFEPPAASPKPGRSMKSKGNLLGLYHLMSLVVPISCPQGTSPAVRVIAFKSDDFPALECPINATSGRSATGYWPTMPFTMPLM